MSRLRNRLVTLLAEAGVTVKAEDLVAAQGIHRQDDTGGSARWGGHGLAGKTMVYLYSMDTMTDCARLGIVVTTPNERHPCDLEVEAKHRD